MIRLAAALLAPVLGISALVVWGPTDGSELMSIANIRQDEAPVGPRTPPPARLRANLGELPVTDLSQRSATSRSKPRGTRPARTARPATTQPLTVTIDNLAPATLPERGPLVVRGTVTNTTDETWTAVRAFAATSYQPMTTAAELGAAATSDPESFIGNRITREGTYDTIDALAPGATASYTLRVPRTALTLTGAPGVYWLGVQVLGTEGEEPRDTFSDGRSRTFLPLAQPGAARVETTVVVPVRRSTLREADGSLVGVDAWAADLAPGGRLSNLVDFAASSGRRRVVWLLDPAVLDAVAQLRDGNPARDLSPTPGTGERAEEEPEGENGSGTSGDDGDGGDGDGGDGGDGDDGQGRGNRDTDPEVSEATRAHAEQWLARLAEGTAGDRVLALPYGDLDVAAAAQYYPGLLEMADELSRAALDDAGLVGEPAVVPPSGLLNDEGARLVGEQSQLLVSTEALPAPLRDAAQPPTTIRTATALAGVYDAALAGDGSGTEGDLDPLSARQRVLAEALVRSLGGDQRPLLVNLPFDFDPGPDARSFFRGLARPYVQLGTTLRATRLEAAEVEALEYPVRQLRRELDPANFQAAHDVIASGRTLDRLLTRNDTVGDQTLRAALGTTSYTLRDDAAGAAAAALATSRWIHGKLDKVRIEPLPFVILSSERGRFVVTVTNDLEQPVRLRIRAHTNRQVEIQAPEFIDLEPKTNQKVTLNAHAKALGVHEVQLIATDDDDQPLGSSVEVSLRANAVGTIIWVVMGAGVGILFLAIVVRLVRRVRAARGAGGPDEAGA